MNSGLSNEEKKQLSYQRQNAVQSAWKQEKDRVSEGVGTRKWSEVEQKELLERGRVSGYEGHHMKSVSLYPEYAGEPKNIQFLSETEHLYGAHGGDYHNLTNGYYDPETGIMHDFGDALEQLPIYDLDNNLLLNSEMEVLKEDYIVEQTQLDTEKDTVIKLKEDYTKNIEDITDNVSADFKSETSGISRR